MDYRTTRKLREQPSTFDIALDNIVASNSQRTSAYEIIWRQQVKAALDGDMQSTRAILKMIVRNDEVRKDRQSRGPRRVFVPWSTVATLGDTAMRILEIALMHEVRASCYGVAEWVRVEAYGRTGVQPAAHHWLPADLQWPHRVQPEGACCHNGVEAARRQASSTRFKPGTSGNRRGRPRLYGYDLPFPFLEQQQVMTMNGHKRRLTLAEVFVHKLMAKALNGDEKLQRLLLTVLGEEALGRWSRGEHHITSNELGGIEHNDSLHRNLQRMGVLSRRSRKFRLLEGWVVEAALDRFGERRLCLHEQAEVVIATSKPELVAWPHWWQVHKKATARRLLPAPPRKPRERDPRRVFEFE